MREIIFRALCSTTKKWVTGYFCKDYSGTAFITSLDGTETKQVDAETLGQYIDHLDRGRYRFYEGDILINPQGEKGVIVYYEAGFYLLCPRKSGQSFYVALTAGFLKNKTQVGTIHDHKLEATV